MADLIQSMSKAFVQPRTNQILNLSDEDLAKRFTFDKELGYGNWGSVWRVEEKVESRNEKGNVLALKLVHRKVTSSTARVKALWSESDASNTYDPFCFTDERKQMSINL